MIFNRMILETVFFFYSSIKLTFWAFDDAKVLNWIKRPRINRLGGSFFSATRRNKWGTHRWQRWSWWSHICYLEYKSIWFSGFFTTLLPSKTVDLIPQCSTGQNFIFLNDLLQNPYFKNSIMGHLERTIQDTGTLAEFATEFGSYCQFDLFGIENSYYQTKPEIDFFR